MNIFITLLALFLLSGCATGAKPYALVGTGYQIDSQSDYLVRTARDYQCSTNIQGLYGIGGKVDDENRGKDGTQK